MEAATLRKEGSKTSHITSIIAQFRSHEGVPTGSELEVPLTTTPQQLEILINHLLKNDDKLPYSFFVDEKEITGDLQTVLQQQRLSAEDSLQIVYQPQAIFRVKAISRCTSSLTGHSEAVLCVSFSPDGSLLASGSGDKTVRLWDVATQTPIFTCTGHSNWVLFVAWSPDGKKVASGGMDNVVRIWDPVTGKQLGTPLKGHKRYVTCIAWEPMHKNPECTHMASASKDGTVKVWNVRLGNCVYSLSSHTMSITALRWGGQNLLYSASQDRSIKVWNPLEGKLVRTLEGHGHWVNALALNTDYVLRKGGHDHTGACPKDKQEAQKMAQKYYDETLVQLGGKERLVSGSDDFTMFLWDGIESRKPVMRMTGHQKLINVVSFSPDGRYIASGSFDHSVKIWSGSTGKFITSLRGHVEAVYQLCWSSDSRMLVSASRDSTCKVWDITTKAMKVELPGHEDQVFCVDWSPDGQKVASGSKDKVLKMWSA